MQIRYQRYELQNFSPILWIVFSHSFLKNVCLFIFLAVLACCTGFSLVAASRGCSSCGAWASLPWLLFLRSMGSRVRLSSCSAWAYLIRGMWDLPRPGVKPTSPALTGGFFTVEPPGKPLSFHILDGVL